MTPSTIRLHRPWRCVRVAFVALLFVLGCKDEETKARERLAGDYVVERGFPNFRVRYVLTLRPDGTWFRIRTTTPSVRPSEPDSGTYRVVGVTINMRSLVVPGVPERYTVVGDTLFSANAAEMQVFTGTDIGEERLVRIR